MKLIKYSTIVIALILILFISSKVRSCYNERQSTRYNVLKGQYEVHKEKTAAEKEELLGKNRLLESRILENKKEIIAAREERDRIVAERKTQDIKLSDLETKFSLISDEGAKIQNLQQQIEVWKSKFSLALEEIETYKAESNRWKLSFEDQVKITELYKAQLRDQEALTELSEQKSFACEKQIKSLRLENTIGKILLTGFCLKTGYEVFKGNKT